MPCFLCFLLLEQPQRMISTRSNLARWETVGPAHRVRCVASLNDKQAGAGHLAVRKAQRGQRSPPAGLISQPSLRRAWPFRNHMSVERQLCVVALARGGETI